MIHLLHWLNGWRWAIHHARRAEQLEAQLSDALDDLHRAIAAQYHLEGRHD